MIDSEFPPVFILYRQLLIFVGEKENIKHMPDIDISKPADEKSQEAFFAAKELLYQRPNEYIIEFCKKNPYKLNNHELAIVWRWNGMQKIAWYIMKHTKTWKTIIMDDDESVLYEFASINQPLSNMLSVDNLPYKASLVLLPYQTWLIYDWFIEWYNLYFSTSIKKSFKDSMRSIEQTIGIYHSFEKTEKYIMNKKERMLMDDLQYYMDVGWSKAKVEIQKIISTSVMCKAYYTNTTAKKTSRTTKREASILWLSWIFQALYGSCVCGVWVTKQEALSQAKKHFPDIPEKSFYIIWL
jgi:hypothetical protein